MTSTVAVKDSIERLHPQDLDNSSRLNSDRRGRVLKGPVRVPGSAPTIPSRFLTIVTNNNEPKGFHGSARRFQYNYNDTPGPGSYVSVPNLSEKLKKTSDSKKGSGGFASSACRTEIKLNPDNTPGAGSYDVAEKGDKRRSDFSTMYSSAFQKPIAQPYEKENSMPAPNAYDVSKGSKTLFKSNNVAADSAFKSHTKREFIQVNKDAPAPNKYDVKDDYLHSSVKVPFSSFKTSSKRATFLKDQDIPGPGEYRPYEPINEAVNRQLFPRRHYLAISAPAVPLPPELPLPGPGAYEVRDSREPVKKYMSSSMFVSSTSRWINGGAGLAKIDETPGPGKYTPGHKVKQSFLYNVEKKWV